MNRTFVYLLVMALVSLAACSSEPDADDTTPLDDTTAPALVGDDGEPAIEILIPEGAGVGLRAAAGDMAEAVQRITGAAAAPAIKEGALAAASPGVAVVLVEISEAFDEELGEQGYTLDSGLVGERHLGVRVGARTEIAGMYGLYRVVADLGVRYHHPEETFYPADAQAQLPWSYDGTPDVPHFALRGFHEHTQHPIEMSDYLLRPDDAFRPYVSRYIRWYARNRQNAMSWHMLKTVELEAWLPYVTDIIEEAHDYGIRVGMVTSFVDQQQNNFKIIDDENLDDEGRMVAPLVQIEQRLGRLADAGFDFFTFQIGSSEFTRPDEGEMLEWLNFGMRTMAERERPVRTYAWIHTTCSLRSDDGGLFFHLPQQADTGLGAWVHTTMFYTLDLPAPVYDCEDFSDKLTFLEQENGRREQVYFPESAWWLGFDNNMPVALPVTGWSRAYDIRQALEPFDVTGHITFTTGREYNYWHYDHFLTAITWDRDFTWSAYLDWIAPMYGERGAGLAQVLEGWTDLQVRHFYEENPLIYFYIAGELRQDEIGEQAGIAARRPKVAFRHVANMDNRTFRAWKASDLDMLERMRGEYGQLLAELSPSQGLGDTLSERLYHEAYTTLAIYVERIDHAIALYSGVVAVRDYRLAVRDAGEEGLDPARRDELFAAATAHLDTARAISADVITRIATMEGMYRYPLDILAREKPETLTGYPFGYLWETSTGHFWMRRDDQLAALIEVFFETNPEEWQHEPAELFYTDPARTEILHPDSALARSVLASFIPQILFGLDDFDAQDGAPRVTIAQDHNENLLPDHGTERTLSGTLEGPVWTGHAERYDLVVHDDAGFVMGELALLDTDITLTLSEAGTPLDVVFDGQVSGHGLVQMVVDVGGIDFDGASILVRQVFGVPTGDPLPERLDVLFKFHFANND